MLRKQYILLFFVALSFSAQAQLSNIRKAVTFLKAEKYDSARVYIDLAKENEKTKNVPSTWYYRGLIYKDLYTKTSEKSNMESLIREEAITSFEKFLEIDTTGKFSKIAKSKIMYISTTYYNDAATTLNPDQFALSIKNYNKYKETVLKADENYSFTDMDKQYFGVLANVYGQVYDLNRETNKPFFNKTVNTYKRVLDIDSNDLSANYNLAIFYYNEAVNIVKEMDFEIDLITIDLIQDETVEMFRRSLPYMMKAYKLNPNRKETLTGLVGIYYSLNELEKSGEMQNELDLLEQKN